MKYAKGPKHMNLTIIYFQTLYSILSISDSRRLGTLTLCIRDSYGPPAKVESHGKQPQFNSPFWTALRGAKMGGVSPLKNGI